MKNIPKYNLGCSSIPRSLPTRIPEPIDVSKIKTIEDLKKVFMKKVIV